MILLVSRDEEGRARLAEVENQAALPGEMGARETPHGWRVEPADGDGWLRVRRIHGATQEGDDVLDRDMTAGIQ